jgi:UDP-N-acetylmuramyl pentapeptide phosphotransferase/UDP-N-acetylglucosamine-1-phosphate transferase
MAALVALPFTLLFLVWMINLYNFMDGMDGLAGGMGVFGFGGLALAGGMAGDELFVGLNLMVVAGLLGFLVWNLPRAAIFLGDAGSSVLGLLAGALAVIGEARGVLPLWAGILLFSPFIFDATLTLLHRAMKREKVWQAHRDHLYQRLVRAGWSSRGTLIWAYLVMTIALMATLLAVDEPSWAWPVIVILGLFYGGIALVVRRVFQGVDV